MIMGKVLTAGRRRKAGEGKPEGRRRTGHRFSGLWWAESVENDKQHRLLRLPFRLIGLGNARMHETISILFPDQSMTCIDICGLWCTLNSYKCTFAEPCTYMGGFGFGIKLKAVFFLENMYLKLLLVTCTEFGSRIPYWK